MLINIGLRYQLLNFAYETRNSFKLVKLIKNSNSWAYIHQMSIYRWPDNTSISMHPLPWCKFANPRMESQIEFRILLFSRIQTCSASSFQPSLDLNLTYSVYNSCRKWRNPFWAMDKRTDTQLVIAGSNPFLAT